MIKNNKKRTIILIIELLAVLLIGSIMSAAIAQQSYVMSIKNGETIMLQKKELVLMEAMD